MKNMRKKSVAVLLGLAVTGLVGASAASLGGVNAEDTLGAEIGDVSSCDDTGVDVGFTTAFETDQVEVRQVEISAVDGACQGLDYSIDLLDTNGASLGSRSGTVDLGGGTAFTTNFGGQNVNAQDVEGIAISISA